MTSCAILSSVINQQSAYAFKIIIVTYLCIEEVVNCDTRECKSDLYSSRLRQIREAFNDGKCLLLSMSSPVMYEAYLLSAYPPVFHPAAQDLGQKYNFAVQVGHLTAEYSFNPNETHLIKPRRSIGVLQNYSQVCLSKTEVVL